MTAKKIPGLHIPSIFGTYGMPKEPCNRRAAVQQIRANMYNAVKLGWPPKADNIPALYTVEWIADMIIGREG